MLRAILVPLAALATVTGYSAASAETGLRVLPGRKDTNIRIEQPEKSVVLDVSCPFGIDRAMLARVEKHWPQSIVVRMRTKGLESFEATSGTTTLQVSVPSTDQGKPELTLRHGTRETMIDRKSPYWTEVRIAAEKKSIPLENGYFEIPLPARLFEGNPQSIELRWVDFYRN